jgi:hypothetical protein
MKMIIDKVHTTRKTGNYVRYFVIVLMFSMVIVACQKENSGPESILGKWSCKENSQVFEVTNYTVDISRSSTDSTKIFIENFYQLGSSYSVTAKINGLNISIPNQTVDGNQISGSGTISSAYDKINWTYSVVAGSTTDHVTAVYTK